MARTLELRAVGQCLVSSTHKFGRFFSKNEHQLPKTWAQLFEYNDVVAYDTVSDPYELVNLAHPRYRDQNKALILKLNQDLNDLIKRETTETTNVQSPWSKLRKTRSNAAAP